MAEPRKRSRFLRTVFAVLAVLAVLVGLGVGAIALLPALAEWVVVRSLEAAGAAPIHLRFEEIGWRQAVISGIRLGKGGTIAVGRLTVRYTPAALLTRHIEALRIASPRLTLGIDDAGRVSLGPFADVLAVVGRGGLAWSVGTVEVHDARIGATTPHADAEVTLEADATHGEDGRYAGSIRFGGTARRTGWPESPFGGSIAFTASTSAVESLSVQLSVQRPPLPVLEAAEMQARFSLDGLRATARASVTSAQGRIDIEGEGRVPQGTGAGALSGHGTLSADLGNISIPGITSRAAVRGRIGFKLADGILEVRANGPVTATVSHFDGLDTAAPALVAWLKGPVTFTLPALTLEASRAAAGVRISGRGRFAVATADGQTLQGAAEGAATLNAGETLTLAEPLRIEATYDAPQLLLPGVRLTAPAASLAGALHQAPERLELTLKGPMVLSAGGLTAPGGVKAGPLSVRLSQAKGPLLSVDLPTGAPARIHAAGVASARNLRFAMGESAVTAHIPALAVTGSMALGGDAAATLEGKGLRVAFPDEGVVFAGVDLTANLGDSSGIVVRSGELRDLGEPARFAPLWISGQATLGGKHADFAARVADRLGRLVVDVTGRHGTKTNAGTAVIELHPLSFAPGVIQPRDLFPAAGGAVSDVLGAVTLAGTVSWQDGVMISDIRAALGDGAFSVGAARVEGLNMMLRLDRPWPPSTPPGQSLRASLITAGIPLRDLDVRFRIAPNGKLHISRGDVRVAGGRIHIDSQVYDPGAAAQTLSVDVAGVALGDLLALAEVDGVVATGRLQGQVPITITGDSVIVRDGVIEAEKPGVLNYAPAQIPAALQGGGEGVSLMLGALKNFHYKTLRLGLDRHADGEWVAILHIKGRNPDFMEGQLFEFNLNLSGPLDRIIRAGLESYRRPQDLGKHLEGQRP